MELIVKENYVYLPKEDKHIFFGKGLSSNLELNTETLDSIIFAYVNEGEGKTQPEIGDVYGYTQQEIAFIFRNVPGGVTKDSTPFSYKTLLELEPAELLEKTLARKAKSYKERERKDQVRLLEAEVRKLREELASRSRIDLSSVVPEVFSKSPTRHVDSSSALLWCFQDWHVGMTYKGQHGRYDKGVFKSRILQMVNYIKAFDPGGYASPTAKCIAIFNGDLLDSVGQMHTSQALDQDVTGAAQLDLAARGVVLLLQALKEKYGTVEVYATPGNHDRVTPKREDDPDRMAHQMLWLLIEAKLSASTSILFREVRKRDCAFNATPNLRVKLHHGDSSKKPLNLVAIDSVHHAGYKLILSGHYHTKTVEEEGNGYTAMVLPSLCGPGRYADQELSLFNKPMQNVIAVKDRDESGINLHVQSFNIFLE